MPWAKRSEQGRVHIYLPWQRIQPSAHADIFITYYAALDEKGRWSLFLFFFFFRGLAKADAMPRPILHEIRLLNASKKQRRQCLCVGRRCEIKIKPQKADKTREQEFAPSSRKKKGPPVGNDR